MPFTSGAAENLRVEVREDLTGFPALLLSAYLREIGMGPTSRDFWKSKQCESALGHPQTQNDPGGGHPVRVVEVLGRFEKLRSACRRKSIIEAVAGKFFRPISWIISIVSLAVLFR
jgi:hypothetical protein